MFHVSETVSLRLDACLYELTQLLNNSSEIERRYLLQQIDASINAVIDELALAQAA